MARHLVPPLLVFAAVALAAASSSAIVTAASHTGRVSINDNNPLDLERIKTCDGGHGVFTCATGDCYFDGDGRFGCCEDLADCTPISSCIPGVDVRNGPKQCDRDDKGCTSCPSKGPVHCMTIRNIGMHQQQITCTDDPKRWSDTSFTYDPKSSVTEPEKSVPMEEVITSTIDAGTSVSSSTSTVSVSSSPSAAAVPEPTPTTSPTPVQTLVYGDEPEDGMTPKTRGAVVVGSIAGAGSLAVALFLLYKWIRAGRPRPRPRNKPAAGTLPTRRESTGKVLSFLKRSKKEDTEALREAYEVGIRSGSREIDIKAPKTNDTGSPQETGFSPTTTNPPPPAGISYRDWARKRDNDVKDSSAPPKPTKDVFTNGAYTIGQSGYAEHMFKKQGRTSHSQGFELSAYPPSRPHLASPLPSQPASPVSLSQPRSPVSPLSPNTPLRKPVPEKNSSSPPYTTTPTPVSPIFSGITGSPSGPGVDVQDSSVADLVFAVAGRDEENNETVEKERPSSIAALNFGFPVQNQVAADENQQEDDQGQEQELETEEEEEKEHPQTIVPGSYMHVPSTSAAEQRPTLTLGIDGGAVEQRQKSSQLLPIAGPYLTAEQALGSGYWEAEREQLAADLAMMGEREWEKEGGKDEGMEKEKWEDAEDGELDIEKEEGDVKDEKSGVAKD